LLSLLAADDIQGSKIDIIQLDTSKFASVKKFATEFKSQYDRLDLLLNNAGVMAQKPRMTEDNFDIQIQTNHLGHFLLTSLLMDQLIAAGRQGGVPARVVNQSSQVCEALFFYDRSLT
jgi:NAD(P)-dependent dehydrogenase (short-subunit alcohol dehydrogenase family)